MGEHEYDVQVYRDGDWFMVAIPAINGLTQTKDQSEVPAVARSYIAVDQNIDPAKIRLLLPIPLQPDATMEWGWLDKVLDGIDRAEMDIHPLPPGADEGWWETSTGAKFGARKLAELKAAITERLNANVDGSTSDGYHTFDELYRYRMLYNAALFNEWAARTEYVKTVDEWALHRANGVVTDVHKSWCHSDGEQCFGGGWFVVSAQLPNGQITNHYPAENWKYFRIPIRPRAAEWDGHTPEEAATRLADYVRGFAMSPSGDFVPLSGNGDTEATR